MTHTLEKHLVRCVAFVQDRDYTNLLSAAPDLLAACEAMQKALYEHHLLDVKKHFSLCVADAAMGTAIARAKGA